MKLIPRPVYPIKIDSNYTLFSVRNSSQTVLDKDLEKSEDFINIVPQMANISDIWPENGFVTIEDELIYYDAVELDDNGKVNVLKDCIRGVEGTPQSYLAGTNIASNVVAQTHNQLVDAVMAIQSAIGDINDVLKGQPDKKNLLPQAKTRSLAKKSEFDFAFTASLNQSLTSMMGCCGNAGDDVCPDIEFEFNNIETTAEYCIRIFGNYNSFTIDFGDGITENTQLSGVHQYVIPGPYNPTVTVEATNCTIVQSPTPANEFGDCVDVLNPAVPFVVRIPEVAPFPEFIAPKQICPGPLMNLPPILLPELNLCSTPVASCSPSVIVSVIEACKTPQIIQIVSPCKISFISFEGCNIPSVISLVGCCLPSAISFSCISFCEPPNFACVSFCPPPSFHCISFCPPPNFHCISFCPPPNFHCISFCPPPSFSCVSFCPPPSFHCVSFCPTPSFSCISFCPPPSFHCVSFCPPPSFHCLVFVQHQALVVLVSANCQVSHV